MTRTAALERTSSWNVRPTKRSESLVEAVAVGSLDDQGYSLVNCDNYYGRQAGAGHKPD
jgi:hypothetical protein